MKTENKVIRPATTGFGCGLGFGFFWLLITVGVVLALSLSGELDRNPFSWFWMVMMGLPGVLFLAWGLYSYYGRVRFGDPTLTLSIDHLRPGQSFDVQFDHIFRSQVQVESFSVELLFRETATYQQGTDTRTVYHNMVFDRYEIPAMAYHSGQSITQTYQMAIPVDGMHTLDVHRNKLQWFIKVEAKLHRLRDYKREYELIVSP